MKTAALFAIALILVSAAGVDDAEAQRRGGARGGGGGLAGPIELSATYGSMWGGNISTAYGKIRTATGGSWGFAIDIPLHEFASLELGYTRQDGGLDWDYQGAKERVTDMSVNYWHIGGVKGLVEGPIRPYVLTTLGVTYYSPTESSVVIDSETYNLDTVTKFSMALGVGLKAYFGEAEKFGIRASFKVLPTLYNTGGGVWFGTGGASLGVTGNAIWQWEAAAGLTVKLGG
jgi:hypothetical protein